MRSLRSLAKRIGAVPQFQRQINLLWNTYEHTKFTYFVQKNVENNQREANIDPYVLYEVPPEDVRSPSGSSFDFLIDTGRVVGGDWDLKRNYIIEGSYFKSFRQHFQDGKPWKNTPLYYGLLQNIKNGENTRYVSEEELQAKFSMYENIYNDFLNEEYRLQSELVQDFNYDLPGNGGRALFHDYTKSSLIRHEISVNIARDGTLIWNDGRHRLALAALAGIDTVPVRVLVRHQQWQDLRDRVARAADTAAKNRSSKQMMKKHISKMFSEELDDIYQGIEHPDLDILLENRCSD